MHEIPSSYTFPEHEHLNCPRCHSNNTKFCYYNNYNLSQPRHYCKNCRRYWTKGGTLRKVPIGGGTRKSNKRSSSSNKRPAASTPTAPPPPPGNLIGGSGKDDLNRTVETDGIQVKYLSVNDDDRSGGGGGGNLWPDLSIFTSGSNFR